MAYPPPNFYTYLSSHGQSRHSSVQHTISTPIDFTLSSSQYEMALIELIIKKNFYNVPSFAFYLVVESPQRPRITKKIVFNEGSFENIFDFCKNLNYVLAQTTVDIDANTKLKGSKIAEVYIPVKTEDVEKITSKTQLTLKIQPNSGIYFPYVISELLGLSMDANINRTEEVLKINLVPTDFSKNFHTLMVLCPNVVASRVNDKMLPALRLFNIDNTDQNETAYLDWSSNPIYFPLNSDYFDKIKLSLADANGKPLSGMLNGETLILIHFRQKRRLPI